MPSGHRTSPSSGRKTESGSSPRLFSVPSHTDAYAATDAEQLLDQLSRVNTQLNQAIEEREKYKYQLEQSKKRSSVSINTSSTVRQPASIQDLKEQVEDLRLQRDKSDDERDQSRANYVALQQEHSVIWQDYEAKLDRLRLENSRLQNENDSLRQESEKLYAAYTQTSSNYNARSSKLPERPKERASKEYHPAGGSSSSSRDKEKKREKEEAKEAKEQNKRLSGRFETDRGRGSGRERERERDTRPPVTKSKRRDSYIEPWGSGAPARGTSRSRQVPRNAPNLDGLRSPVAYSSGSGGSAIDDTEDGNYHPYPVQQGR